MHVTPESAPKTLYDAFSYIGTVTLPTLDDLKLMVILEAAGQAMYDDLAAGSSDPEIETLLSASGCDELEHARRVSRAIGLLTGTDYPVPARDENPYLVDWVKPDLTETLLHNLAEAEFGGEEMYGLWAASCKNAEVADLFRQSGREETLHGDRLEKIAELLAV